MSIRYSRFVVAPLIVVLMLGFTGCKRTSTTTESVPQQDESVLAQPGSLDVAFIRVSVKVPAFSGLYFDDKHVLHVLLVGDASRTVVRNEVIDAIVRAGLLDRSQADQTQIVIEPSKTPYTWFDLDDFKAGMRDVLTLPDVTYLDADEAQGVVTIGIAKDNARARVQEFADRVGLPKDAWRTVLSPYRDRYQAVTDQIRPMVGGIQIKNDAGPFAFLGFAGICTMSVVADRLGAAGFITNSHCTRIQGGVEATSFFQNGRTPFSLDYVAHESTDPVWSPTLPGCPLGFLCRRSDSAFAVIDIGNQNGAKGSVARPSLLCSTGIPCPTAMPSSSARITITGMAPAPITGSALTKVGRTTGWTGGFVTATCIDTLQSGSTFMVLCQTDFSNVSGPGDSGSPVFAVPGPGLPPIGGPLPTTGTLAGVLWGGNGTTSVFSPINAVVSELGSISLFTSAPTTAQPSATSACKTACGSERDACMRDVASPHGPRPQQCVGELRACLVECK